MCYHRVYFDSSFEVVWTWEEILQFLAWFVPFGQIVFNTLQVGQIRNYRRLIVTHYLWVINYDSYHMSFVMCENLGNLQLPFL